MKTTSILKALVRRTIPAAASLFLLIVLTTAGPVLAGAPAATQKQVVNLVQNPSFEEPEPILEDPAWRGWTAWGEDAGLDSTLAYVTSERIDGVRSLRIDPKGAANKDFVVEYYTIPQKVDTKYTVSFWAKAQAPRPLTVQMKAVDDSVTLWDTAIHITTDWAEYKFTVAAQSAKAKLWFLCAGSEIPLWLDFVNVYEGEYVPDIKPSKAASLRRTDQPTGGAKAVTEPLSPASGQSGRVNAVAFSPDGRAVASGSVDNTVQLWRVSDAFLVHKLMQGQWGWVMSLAFSPDGTTLASGNEDKTVCVWRVADGCCLRKLRGHTGAVATVAFSPDGAMLATGSFDASIKLWRVSDGGLLRTLPVTQTSSIRRLFPRMERCWPPAAMIGPSVCGACLTEQSCGL
jgi:WD40 repeat protein